MARGSLGAVLLTVGAWMGFAMAAPVAHAQTWPTRPVTIVSPFAAGSGVDLLARHVAGALQAGLGQPFIVEDRSGANGNVGAAYAAKAAPDGGTILVVTPGIAVQNKFVYKAMPFDFERDFSPIVLVSKAPMMIMVHPSLPIQSMADLLAYAKAHPGALHVSSSGVGSQPHITLERLKSLAGVEMIHVPYNSAAQQNQDLLSGHIEVGINYVTTTIGFVKAGSVRPLAVTSATRLADLPDVPTLEELGFKGFEAVGWYGLYVPRGTPDLVAERVAPIVNAYLKTDEAKTALRSLGMQAAGGDARDLTAWIAQENERWGDILKRVVVPE